MSGMISTDPIRGHTDTIILNILRQVTAMAMKSIKDH